MTNTPLRPLMLALMLPAAAAVAQQKMDDMKPVNAAMKPTAIAQMAHAAVGTVKKVDAKAGMVILAHEPVKTMNWPAMTMAFKVKDKMLFDKLADGRKVEFEFVPEGKDYVLKSVK